jgi:hypothetical protein
LKKKEEEKGERANEEVGLCNVHAMDGGPPVDPGVYSPPFSPSISTFVHSSFFSSDNSTNNNTKKPSC